MDGTTQRKSKTPITTSTSASLKLTASEICRRAAVLTGAARHRQHGKAERNHANIAAFWTTYLERAGKLKPGYMVTALDVANLMECLKIARRLYGDYNRDDYIDGAGYAAVAGEIADDDVGLE